MLDDLAVCVEAKDVDSGPRAVSGPFLMAVEDNIVALCDCAPYFDSLPGILLRHSSEVVDESLLSIGDHRVVLDVFVADIELDGFGWTRLIEHELVKSLGVLLVSLESLVHHDLGVRRA